LSRLTVRGGGGGGPADDFAPMAPPYSCASATSAEIFSPRPPPDPPPIAASMAAPSGLLSPLAKTPAVHTFGGLDAPSSRHAQHGGIGGAAASAASAVKLVSGLQEQIVASSRRASVARRSLLFSHAGCPIVDVASPAGQPV
jgi:hypothetical protein